MNIPSTPHRVYGREWRGWGDWLGTGAIANQDRVYLCFTDAREIVRALNLKGQKEWCEWSKSKHRLLNIPSAPARVYGGEWRGHGDWLGTGYCYLGPSRQASIISIYKSLFKILQRMNSIFQNTDMNNS